MEEEGRRESVSGKEGSGGEWDGGTKAACV
jgi:hypothetical protein